MYLGPVLQATNLSKQYKNGTLTNVLSSVTFSIDRGEFISITGPSGSGKTTLLNIIGTLDQPTSGSLSILGENVLSLAGTELADFRRGNIGFVFQLFNLVPVLTALENVMLPLTPYVGANKSELANRAAVLLERVGLKSRMDHLPGALSGGEKQRVAVARALINNPSLILADEPTGNLDSEAGGAILELLKEVKQTHETTLVIVTHDSKVAASADRNILLKDGRIEIKG